MAFAIHFPPSRCTTLALALLPVAIPAVYLLYLSRVVSKNTQSSSGCRIPRKTQPSSSATPSSSSESTTPWNPVTLPEDVRADDSQWILAYERVVSHPIPTSSLSVAVPFTTTNPPATPATASTATPADPPDDLLRDYSRATQAAFSWTPQALLIRSSIREPHVRRTFDADWIANRAFAPGDLVNGVYRVAYRGPGRDPSASDRVELVLEAPPSYRGPVPRALIVSEVVEASASPPRDEASDEQQVVFVNETWMWRRQNEKPVLIETPAGKWLHTLLAGWLVTKGVQAVVGDRRTSQ
ncbi:hypothetical protein ACRALDRAFT_1064236 [Sodiomyces alcalophilus JCM 7366]|uniref:uncharacterized protein n=1 Tax=Sodiomyces alcalophilus JCM 7366 TaxID=591952 RepID=UPI0039B36DA3